ncbi:hypothetical protein ID866_2873 [Astraeus odoratus]|nr:hypothetical protein ID866_2873 [Astraeus odoratus]
MSAPANRPPPQLAFDPNSLPISQLESLKFKANQIIESIQTLQRTIEAGGQNVMPPWPDILSKYNLILSQTHSFYSSLTAPLSAAQSYSQQTQTRSPYEKIALHPSVGMADAQFDNEIIPLLRNQQTTDVLQQENATVRRLAECMVTRGALAASSIQSQSSQPPPTFGTGRSQRITPEDVLQECAEIRDAHDRRVDRAVRAVLLLRDKYEWKQRVAVEVEEPEELGWDPRQRQQNVAIVNDVQGEADVDIDPDDGQSSDEEEVIEGELARPDDQTPSPAPRED